MRQSMLSIKHTDQVIYATAVLHNMCTLMNDMDDEFFDDLDSSAMAEYERKYTIDRILCPQCKKRSNAAMAGRHIRCDCNFHSLLDRLDAAYFHAHPNIAVQLQSDDPKVRRDAYKDILFLTKPANFVC